MELIQKYVYEIYTQKSFTKAAKKLFISQPALSSAVSKYEKKLGFRIFDRSRSPVLLTPEGRVLVESYEEIMKAEEMAKIRIKSMKQRRETELKVGGASSSIYLILPEVCSQMQKTDPGVTVKIYLDVLRSASSVNKLENGELDLMIDYVKRGENCENTLIAEDEMIVAVRKNSVPNKKLLKYASSYADLFSKEDRTRVKDFSLFRDVVFLPYAKNGKSMDKKMSELFGEYAVSTVMIESSPNALLHHFLARKGCGALLTNVTAAKELFSEKDEMLYFFLDSEYAKRSVYIITKAGGQRSELVERFIELSKEAFSG